MIKMNGEKKKIYAIYSLGFLFSIHLAFTAYVNSTFLSVYAPEKFVGILYTIGSILTILALAIIPYVLRRLGNYKTLLILSVVEVLLLLGLATFKTILFLAPIFIIKILVVNVIYFNLDVFLESKSSDKETGSIRGAFMTIMSVAWVMSPILAGFILTNGDYWKIYTISAGLMLLMTIMLIHSLKSFRDPKYIKIPFWETFMQVWKNKNIYKIFMANLILSFFYSWMVIYTPIYLHEAIGFEWSEVGIIFTIMLLPFMLFELPAGKLSDTRWGEKELLSLGFVLMAIATGTLTFITGANIIVWASILFLTRAGASLVEIMTETYFFKQIDSTDTNIIGFFRNTRPLAYIIAPIIAFVFLSFFEQKYLFLFLGAIILLGLRYSITLKDTL